MRQRNHRTNPMASLLSAPWFSAATPPSSAARNLRPPRRLRRPCRLRQLAWRELCPRESCGLETARVCDRERGPPETPVAASGRHRAEMVNCRGCVCRPRHHRKGRPPGARRRERVRMCSPPVVWRLAVARALAAGRGPAATRARRRRAAPSWSTVGGATALAAQSCRAASAPTFGMASTGAGALLVSV